MSLADSLPHVNAGLNALATLLLVAGYIFILLRREDWHKYAMVACFGVSAVFLGCYLTHKFLLGGLVYFPDYPGPYVKYGLYLPLLVSHSILAAATPFLAIWTIYLGWIDDRYRHRWWAWWTLPIWLYVSITGVLVYLLLYQIYPPLPPAT